jgi:hypothetical protein
MKPLRASMSQCQMRMPQLGLNLGMDRRLSNVAYSQLDGTTLYTRPDGFTVYIRP